MELNIDLIDIQKGIKELFCFAFIANCALDDESITAEEQSTIEDLTPSEVLENLKELIVNLLTAKKEFKGSDKAELVQRTEQLEQLLQKVEAEVRNHIRIEYQLKLHIENHQQRINELEKIEATDRFLIKELEGKTMNKSSKFLEIENVKKEYKEKVADLSEIIDRKEKYIQKLETENNKLRKLIEEKVKDFEGVKKELVKISKVSPVASARHLEKIKKKRDLKKHRKKMSTDGGRSDRKSAEEKELKVNFSELCRGEKKDAGKLTSRNSNKHGRSNSYQKGIGARRHTSND